MKLQNEKLNLNFANSKKNMMAYDTDCIVRYIPNFKLVVLNSKIEIRIFKNDDSKAVRKCIGNCILQINEQTPDCTKNIIQNPYYVKKIRVEVNFNDFKLKESSYNELSKELELKLINSKEEYDSNELIKLYGKGKSTIDQNYFWIILGILSLFVFGIGLTTYCCYKKYKTPIRYVSRYGLIFKN